MLSALLRALPKDTGAVPDPEDYFYSSLGLIFTDDIQNQHGDPDTTVRYRSNGYGDLVFEIADPEAEVERQKFAHHLWNAGVLIGEFVGGRKHEGTVKPDDHEWGQRKYADGLSWWLNEEEEKYWSVEGETVLELGAGVGLAGIMSILAGAKEVTLSDYPAESIINTLKLNVSNIVPPELKSSISVEGHQWGDITSPFAVSRQGWYTRVLAADTLWLAAEHGNLARSMEHFLSPLPTARILLIAGFHTGRAKIAAFFEDTVLEHNLEAEEIFEMDADGRRRSWDPNRTEEPVGERKKWLVIARLRRRTPRP